MSAAQLSRKNAGPCRNTEASPGKNTTKPDQTSRQRVDKSVSRSSLSQVLLGEGGELCKHRKEISSEILQPSLSSIFVVFDQQRTTADKGGLVINRSIAFHAQRTGFWLMGCGLSL
ncbi:hypothetical protein BaRGS_00022937 [Batillaria attramentaria]|uniref:Uncharacterized protein n=1 Tax=Batillaria attramentaria TaxID=370345 RepID=A0ABD0KFM8_9CAEN